jgi:DNA-binding transcriptional regulator YhcF (GntR family)
MNLRIDRELPVPVGVQLRGLIEYGIDCGELAPGTRLPSVRGLAADLHLAPMTVSQVYKELSASGLLQSRAGSGTFVAAADGVAGPSRLQALQPALDRLIAAARAAGMSAQELQALVGARLLATPRRGQGLRIVLVGLFEEATRDYARQIEARIAQDDVLEAVTLDALRRGDLAQRKAAAADLVLTFAHLRVAVAGLLPAATVQTVRFIPAEAVRSALAGLDPRARLGIVATFGAFLPLMKAGVRRFAPHVADIAAGALDAPGLEQAFEDRDTVVHATGAEAVLGRLGPDARVIEYRHMPDPADVDRTVLPLLARLRAGRTERAAAEHEPDEEGGP